MFSAGGTVVAFNAMNPKYADLSLGLGYVIVFANQTDADITIGTYLIEGADASSGDPCTPDTWAPLKQQPDCAPDDPAAPNASITFSASNPLKANAQCRVAVPCPKQFLRVSPQGATEVDIVVVVTRLKRTGM